MKHTSGPWELNTMDAVHDSKGVFIHLPELRDRNRQANARLISACPDMLHALMAVANDAGSDSLAHGTEELITEAIAKATGA